MRLPPKWLRRILVDPLWVVLALVLAALFGLVAVLSGLLSPLTPRRRVLRLSTLAASYLLLDLGMLLGCAWLWCRHPRRGTRNAADWSASHVALLKWTLRTLLSVSRWTLGFELSLPDRRDPLDDDSPVVVLSRHAGPGDSCSLVWLIIDRYERCPRVVLKEALQWDPGLDLMLNHLSSCFLPSRTGAGDDATDRIDKAARELRAGDALLIFPEGGNWTPRRHSRAVTRLRRSGHVRAARRAAARPNVLPPRPAGTIACLVARPDLDVVVVAHQGVDDLISPATMWRALPLVDRPMTIHAWREQASTIPREPEAIVEWLDVEWQRVEKWIEQQKSVAKS